jgi:hypothetical protein
VQSPSMPSKADGGKRPEPGPAIVANAAFDSAE